MTNPSYAPWSRQPNAPKVPYRLHQAEHAIFAGALIGMVFYGIIIVLFLQCMVALLDPVKRRQGRTMWLLVVHTVATFSLATLDITTAFWFQISVYIENREFSGFGKFPPGPLGYALLKVAGSPVDVVADVPMVSIGWLADGLLLYRCYVIHAMNFWVAAFSCIIYLASVGIGVMRLWQRSLPHSTWADTAPNFGVIYLSISVSLNTVLTLMIAIRLGMHNRMVLRSIGTRPTTSGLYKFVVAVLVESCALYTVSTIVLLGVWNTRSYLTNYILPLVGATQVIAPFLITLRIANRTALTNDNVTGSVSSIHFKTQDGSVEGEETAPDGSPVGSVNGQGDTSDRAGAGAEDLLEEVPI